MRLPDAPLLEVVFELRWDVPITGPAAPDAPFGYDPGFLDFHKAYDAAISKEGFTSSEVIAMPGPTFAHAVVKRYRRAGDQPFPLVQIGHGIFACNLSTEYEWSEFEKFALRHLSIAAQCYPLKGRMKPIRAELRYVDIFNADLIKHNSIERFLQIDTKIKYKGFDFLSSGRFTGDDLGLVRLRRDLAKPGIGWFQMELGSANAGGTKGMLLNSRVVKEAGFDEAVWREDIKGTVGHWLRDAHDVTSEFFKAFVSDKLMRAFTKKK